MTAIDKFPRAALDPAGKTGLILCGMGGPDGPEAVRPFLRNLFRDPLIFPVPKLFAGIAGWMIAWRRSPEVRERYAMISDDSSTPQLPTTWKQARVLAEKISSTGRAIEPGVAMRYWDPYPDEAIAELMGQDMVTEELHLEPDQGSLRAALYNLGAVEAEDYDDDGVAHLSVRLLRSDWNRLMKKGPEPFF
jgi:hypothetical protein